MYGTLIILYLWPSIQETDIRQERLYFFQFPNPFPTYLAKIISQADPTPVGIDYTAAPGKKVSFASDSKPPSAEVSVGTTASSNATNDGQNTSAEETAPKIDGIIGQLEVHRSGAVKMRLGNGIVMDVGKSSAFGILTSPLIFFSAGHCCNSAIIFTTCRIPRFAQQAAKCSRGSK